MKRKKSLAEKHAPSEPCSCETCLNYCKRPGWWNAEQASQAMAEYGSRMILEMSPEWTFGVLSPAFYGCEGNFALQEYSQYGCNFLKNTLCELHGTKHQPLECRFCHHDRKDQGIRCHSDIERKWKTPVGRSVIDRWIRLTGFRDAFYYAQVIQGVKR
jgi:hypothetical protein